MQHASALAFIGLALCFAGLIISIVIDTPAGRRVAWALFGTGLVQWLPLLCALWRAVLIGGE